MRKFINKISKFQKNNLKIFKILNKIKIQLKISNNKININT